jgi:hypothetical protein
VSRVIGWLECGNDMTMLKPDDHGYDLAVNEPVQQVGGHSYIDT